jgi:flagellar hook-associated protein 2
MASIVNFSGLGSNIDFGAIRDAIIAGETKTVTQLQTTAGTYGTKVSTLQQLNASLASLTLAAKALVGDDLGTQNSATSSNTGVLSVSTGATASAGTFNVTVNRLASSLSQASNGFASKSATILPAGFTQATFQLQKGGAASGPTITIDSTNNSLQGLQDAINKATGGGVTASIVDVSGDGTQNQLVLTSTATGQAGRVQLVETSSTGLGSTLGMRSLNPPLATTDFSALDSSISINGLSIARSSNNVSDAVSGVTLNLQQTGTSSVTVAASSDIQTKLQTFVSAYNTVQGLISAQYKPGSTGAPSGVLVGDPVLRNIQSQMREALNAISTSNGGSLQNLTDIGIGRDSNNLLTLDTKVLTTRMTSNSGDVIALLKGVNGNTGLFGGIYTASNNLSDGVTGQVQTAITGYQSSIKSINKRVADQTDRINKHAAALTKQFAAVDAAIGQLNGQGTALTNMLTAMQASSKNN